MYDEYYLWMDYVIVNINDLSGGPMARYLQIISRNVLPRIQISVLKIVTEGYER